jgi:hypothetical protein
MRKSAYLHHLINICEPTILNEFKIHLNEKNQLLSFSLIKNISEKSHLNDNELIDLIYNNNNEKTRKRFNQLYFHTFNIFAKFLIIKYPEFLSTAITTICACLKQDKLDIVRLLLNDSLSIAEKIEDFEHQLILINLYRQIGLKNNLDKNYILDNIKIIEFIYQFQDTNINKYWANKQTPDENEINTIKKYFDHPSDSIRFLSLQTYLYLLSNYNLDEFYKIETKYHLQNCRKLITNKPYLKIFSNKKYLLSIDYLELKYNQKYLDINTINNILKSNIDENLSYENIMFALSIKGSCYLTNYIFTDAINNLENEIKNDLKTLENLKQKNIHKLNNSIIHYIHFKIIKSVFLLLNNKPSDSLNNLESTIFQLQQQSFKKFYDEIFVLIFLNLISLNKYDEVIDQFKRYKKIVKNNFSIKENFDLIHVIYYSILYLYKKKNATKNKLLFYYNELNINSKENQNIILVKRIWNKLNINPIKIEF